eukprot:jgi/Tetstr1/455952/TSEL_042733.t1
MSTSITTGMMNTPVANLARQSAIKTDPGNAPPPPDFRDDTSSDDAFSLDDASDSDSGDIQHIKPAAVKPTLDLKNVPIWDNTVSTRDNSQAIKISLGIAGYLDTTKGKAWKALLTELQGSAMEERKRLEEEIIAGQLPNEQVQVYVRRYQNLWNPLNKAHGQWTFEYVATNYLISGLHPDYDHIVDTAISAATVNENLATIISAGQNMEARKRQRQQCVRAYPPNLNYYNPRDPQHATGADVVCRSQHHSSLPIMLTCPTAATGGAASGAQEGEGEDNAEDDFHDPWHVSCSDSDDDFKAPCVAIRHQRYLSSPMRRSSSCQPLWSSTIFFSPYHKQQSVNRQPSPRATSPYVLVVIDDWKAGLAERSFRTIGECAQAMLLHVGLDCTFWDWAYLHALYLCNRQWSSSVNAISP